MSAGQSRSSARLQGSPAREPHGLLPAWPAVLAVVAHPDDESFGLGAIIDRMTSAGAAVHVLCYTRGEASTLNQTGADLLRQRARELRQAGAALGVSTVALLDYPGRPPGCGTAGRAGRAHRRAGRPVSSRRAAGLRRHRHYRPSRSPVRHAGGRPRRRPAQPARAGVGAAGRHRRPPAGRDRPAVRRPAARAAGLRHPGQPDPAAPGRAAACQPGLPRSAALAAAGAARRYRAPALARAAVRRRLSRAARALWGQPGLRRCIRGWQYLRRSCSSGPSGPMDTMPGYGKLSCGGARRELQAGQAGPPDKAWDLA